VKLKKGEIDAYLEAQNVIIDIMLLSEGDAFVGKFSSNIDRIAFALLSAKKKGLSPYTSLDSKWCFDFGQQAGQTKLGPFRC
jgi:hypothetical protein